MLLRFRRLTPYPLGYTGKVIVTVVTVEECHQTLNALSEDRTQDLLLFRSLLRAYKAGALPLS